MGERKEDEAVADHTGDNQKPEPTQSGAVRPKKRKSKRGGRRPGAGAPKGNMNALRTGAYSKQFALLGRLLAADPKVRDALLQIAQRADRKFKTANEVAAFLLVRYREHVEAQAEAKYAPKARKRRAKRDDRSNYQLPVDDWDSIKEAAARFE